MCNFASFVIEKEKPYRIFAYDLFSHTGVEETFNLAPDSYVEAEWTDDSPEALKIRTFENDQDESWYKAIVLGDYPTRTDLLRAFMPDGALSERKIKDWYKNAKPHQEDGPAIIRLDGTQEWYNV